MDGLSRVADSFGIRLTQRHRERIVEFVAGLLAWNEKINLTSITNPEDVLVKHVLDSMIPGTMIGSNERVVDLGAGAGFPGIPLKILLEDLQLYLVEATRKKAAFLEWVVRRLGMAGVVVKWARAEDEGLVGSFSDRPVDVVITRAALKDSQVLAVGQRMIGKNGRIMLMKGWMSAGDENEIVGVAKEFGMRVAGRKEYRLPGMDRDRNVVILESVG